MGTELESGPFCYIVHAAQLFKKTEEDMGNLEDILTSLPTNMPGKPIKRNSGESTPAENILYETGITSAKMRIQMPNAVVGTITNRAQSNMPRKSAIQRTIQTMTAITNDFNIMNMEKRPHWLARVIEFYMSILNAFGDLRKFLKLACKEYARAVIAYMRLYKRSAELISENMENDIGKAIESLRQKYEAKIEGLTSMMRMCEKQRFAISENKMELLSEVEITRVEIICIKETTVKLLPTITMQEELLQVTSQKVDECQKVIKRNEENYTMIKNAKMKLIKHNERIVASRIMFLQELRKANNNLVKSLADAQRELEKIKLKDISEKENHVFQILNNKTVKNKVISKRKQKRISQKELQKIFDEICVMENEMTSLEDEERRTLLTLQTVCVSSHKQRSELKKTLATNINKLQNLVYDSKLKADDWLMSIEQQVSTAKENYDCTSIQIETLEDNYVRICDRSEEVANTRNDLKNMLEDAERNLQELDINLLMIQNGFKKFIQKLAPSDNSETYVKDEEPEILFEARMVEAIIENVKNLEVLKYRLHHRQRVVCNLREKEKSLERSIQERKYENQCLEDNAVALAHTYMTIIMLPTFNSSLRNNNHVSLLKDGKLETSQMPDILMTGSCNIDSSLPQVNKDDQSSKRSRKKSKTWTRFESTLRRKLVNEFCRAMKVR